MPNPFFYGGPITEPQKFFGRKREFRVIFGRLSTTPPQSVSVVGERRIGRTSLLYHLTQVYSQWLTDAERYLFAYVDLQSARCHTRAGLLAKMLEALLQQARLDRRSDDGQWLTDLRERISEGEAIDLPCFGEALERIKALGYRSVICLDEFEKLTARPQEFGDDLLDSWRNMAQFGHIAFITASKVPLELLSRTGRLTSPFFNIFAQVPLGELELDEARELITQPSDRPFTEEEVRLALRLAGCHPFRLQIACSLIYEEKARGRVDQRQVRKAYQMMVKPLLPSQPSWAMKQILQPRMIPLISILAAIAALVGIFSVIVRNPVGVVIAAVMAALVLLLSLAIELSRRVP